MKRKAFQGFSFGHLMIPMTGRTKRKPVKVTIPWDLYIELVQLQAEENLTWDEACKKGSILLDPSKEKYMKDVEKKAMNINKSRRMTEFNKSKKKWQDEGFERGATEYRIAYPCTKCNDDIIMKPGGADHEAMKIMMQQAGWHHSKCDKQ